MDPSHLPRKPTISHVDDDRSIIANPESLSERANQSEKEKTVLTSSLCVQEHVLRDVSNSSDPTSRQFGTRSSSIITNSYNDLPAEDASFRGQTRHQPGRFSKYSPTPSMKRGKAERLLKEHGSPPGVRVTAGGRIVPDGHSPITSPHAFQAVPFHNQIYNRIARPYNGTTGAALNVANGMIFNVGNGVFAQFVNGEFQPIDQQNGIAQLHVPFAIPIPISVPNYTGFNTQPPSQTFQPLNVYMPNSPFANYTPPTDDMAVDYTATPSARQIRVMEQVHSKLEQELKDLDRNEVLQRSSLNAKSRAEIVKNRIELINRIDTSRLGIIEAKRTVNRYSLSTNTILASHPSTGLGIYNADRNEFATGLGMGAYHNEIPQDISQPNIEPIPNSTHQHPTTTAPVEYPKMSNTPLVQNQRYREVGGEHQNLTVYEGIHTIQDMNTDFGRNNAIASTSIQSSTDIHNPYPSNLDGSAHQPRRSHAIEIKVPKDVSQSNKSFLNPISPAYQPNQISGKGLQSAEGSVFIPSPTLIAQTENLVRSPHSENYDDDTIAGQHQPSDDSATTADFFPHNANQHTSRNFSLSTRDIHVNLPAWMKQDHPSTTTTPGQSLCKSIWNEGSSDMFYASPSDHVDDVTKTDRMQSRRQSSVAKSSVSPHNAGSSCDMDFIKQSAFTPISPTTQQYQSAHLRESVLNPETCSGTSYPHRKISASSLLQQVSAQAELAPICGTPVKSNEYWEGHKTGIRQAVLGNDTSDDYRHGYRDGIIQSSISAPVISGPLVSRTTPRMSTPGSWYAAKRAMLGSSQSSISKDERAPDFQIPGAPHNSLTTTPTAHRSLKNRSSALSLDSPKAEEDFMSQPNIITRNGMSNAHRSVTPPVGSKLRSLDPPSPLANRKAIKSTHDMMTGKAATAISPSLTVSYDYQRFQKGKPSVAQTDHSARAFISGQNDGSAPDINRSIVAETHAHSYAPLSPRSRMSPVRSAATAAVASIAHLTRSGGRKEQDCSKMSSPEKRAWRPKWKTIPDVPKDVVVDEIDAFKKKFEMH